LPTKNTQNRVIEYAEKAIAFITFTAPKNPIAGSISHFGALFIIHSGNHFPLK
jgi:hypothetical protein